MNTISVVHKPLLITQEWIQILGASLFIALMTQIQIFLPFTPVPITGQTFAVMSVGAFLGSRKGILSVFLYLAQGAIGLPFYTKAGFGVLHFLGPTGGYMIGFLVQAYIVGWLLERMVDRRRLKVLGVLLLSSAAQMGLGLLWLSHLVSWEHLLLVGLYPFILGEILKAVAVTHIYCK